MIFRHCLIALGLVLSVSAQDNALIEARALCFQYMGDVKSVFVPGEKEDEMIEVPLYTSVMTEPFKMRATNSAGVFSLPSDNDEVPYKPLPGSKLPGSSKVLFLFLPSSDPAKSPYRIVALADDTRSFPYGAVRLMNLHNKAVRFHMGEHNGASAIGLNPGKSKLVDEIQRLDDFNRYPVLAEYASDKGFAGFYNNAWRSVEGKRDLVIVYPDPKSGLPRLNYYEDAEPADLGPPPGAP